MRIPATLVVAALSLCSLSLPARSLAADYPDHAVTIVVPFSAGGTTDLVTRALAENMSKPLGTDVVVDNKVGAAGTIGTADVARARPDGYTVGMLPVGPLTTQTHLRHLPYRPDSFDYVCMVYSDPQALVVRKDSRFKTLKDFVDYAKAHPDKITFATTGPGTIPHLGMLQLENDAHIRLVHVPYKGEANILTAILGNHIDAMVAHPAFVADNADSLRALAVMAPERMTQYPDLPTFKEEGYPVDAIVWGGLAVPKRTPQSAVEKLSSACKAATSSETFQGRLKNLKMPAKYMGHDEFSAFVKKEYELNGKLLKQAGLVK